MSRISVGIVGAGSGAGVTHLCLVLAQYSAQVMMRRTAVVELSGNHAMAQMNTTTDKRRFQIGRVTCFQDVRLEEMADILTEDYQVYILDMGSDFYRVRAEFVRCDRQIVVGDLNPWKKMEYECFLSEIIEEEDYQNWTAFLMSHGRRRDKSAFQKTYGLPVYRIPNIENPFELKKEHHAFLRGLL